MTALIQKTNKEYNLITVTSKLLHIVINPGQNNRMKLIRKVEMKCETNPISTTQSSYKFIGLNCFSRADYNNITTLTKTKNKQTYTYLYMS